MNTISPRQPAAISAASTGLAVRLLSLCALVIASGLFPSKAATIYQTNLLSQTGQPLNTEITFERWDPTPARPFPLVSSRIRNGVLFVPSIASGQYTVSHNVGTRALTYKIIVPPGSVTNTLTELAEMVADYVISAGGSGSGSMTTVKANGSQVGGADIVTLNFSSVFSITESPDTEINLDLDPDLATWAGITPSANAITFISAADYAAMRTALSAYSTSEVDADLALKSGLADNNTFTGNNTFAGGTATRSGAFNVHTMGSVSGAVSVNLSTNAFTVTLGGNTTFTFTDWPALASGAGRVFRVTQDATGNRTVTNALTGSWVLNPTPNSTTIISLLSLDGGTTATASSSYAVAASGTPDDDSVTPAKMADGDFGDFTVASNVATLDAGVVSATKLASDSVVRAKIGDDAVGDAEIEWGTGAGQVSAVDVPIADTGGLITATEVEGALAELKTAINGLGGFSAVELDTADDTVTPIYTNAVTDGTSRYVEAIVLASGPTNAASFKLAAHAHNVGGTLTLVRQAPIIALTNAGSAAVSASFTTSGTNIVLRGQGLASENIHWSLANLFTYATTNHTASSSGPTYYLQETFDATGYDLAGWTESYASEILEDYTTSPAPLQGTQSVFFNTTATRTLITPTHTALAEKWESFMLHITSGSIPATDRGIHAFRDSANNPVLAMTVKATTGLVELDVGTGTATSAAALSVGTTYYFWIRYVKGTGSNAVGEVYWSTTTTPGAAKVTVTNGTSTNDSDKTILAGYSNFRIMLDDYHVSDGQHSF